ncbi:MAG TPA: hypothetical protein VFP37_14650 [Steroidobacteraceae bacterium]|nr:hypothetical protein [Steroidobacteraceae bacterium]
MKVGSILACIVAGLASSGCATIVAKSSQTITVTSVPEAASVSIVNKSGRAVHSGATPLTVTLKKGRGYFKPETYTVRFAKEGYQPREIVVRGEVNGWYFGNVIFGGLIGLLAVDPATGAMYTLKPKEVGATLDTLKVSKEETGQSLTVVLLAQVPAHQRDQLIPVEAN